MKLISRDELKKKIDNQDDFKLVMTLGTWQYMAKHIPGSLHVDAPEKAKKHLHPDDEIVVYCTNEYCVASRTAYRVLVADGYKNVRRYAGGITDWEKAGYPLEGEMVD